MKLKRDCGGAIIKVLLNMDFVLDFAFLLMRCTPYLDFVKSNYFFNDIKLLVFELYIILILGFIVCSKYFFEAKKT